MIAIEGEHSCIHRLNLSCSERAAHTQVANLTDNETIHRPENGIDVREPNPAHTYTVLALYRKSKGLHTLKQRPCTLCCNTLEHKKKQLAKLVSRVWLVGGLTTSPACLAEQW